ncbi:hypothetical protein JJ685_25915 [Ramlibacter monticola]|uniref:Uncharacterized protein n=1 Tax=Ramlibacter monticola TaxID=1926872 RepID=A0A936Z8K8_9BURK|nr:hypothetical protein [Ramlibacter monticola]MBL0394601.1 hypothetical protein [Ramlibacter monticola]
MKNLSGLVFLGLVSLSNAASAGYNCLFGLAESSEYCVGCPGKDYIKVEECPGGHAGLITLGPKHPGCGIDYYDGRRCIGRTAKAPTGYLLKVIPPAAGASGAARTVVANSADRKAADAKYNAVGPGKTSIIVEGDEVILRMKKADFDRIVEKSIAEKK